ncbi:hypothetical protein GCM10027169_08600 [Gordonia jinhuaensis]|uniref:Low molecular weight antigen MTB12-like C-terminal domain-containing protein n=2 Tax=Gordonia jinhuaensis TaxID=1517702 RepID=A0A916WZ65_9ACTN|nr:hypothetical protein GCM10011489_32110 [Gordonia jinhuaensis]
MSDQTSSKGSGVNMPTVLVSAGVSAVISALIVTIGVVGILVAHDDNNSSSASAAQPTVVNLGAAADTAAAGATTAGAPASAAPGAPKTGAAAGAPAGGAPAAENVPEEAPANAGGAAPAAAGSADTATADAPAAAAAPAAPAQTPTAQTSSAAAPAPLTPGQLTTKVNTILNTNASSAARADELQAGAGALSTANGIANALRLAGPVYKWRIAGPVTVSGDTLTATLVTSLVGYADRTEPITFVWMDGKWKLSNKSACSFASHAMLSCNL